MYKVFFNDSTIRLASEFKKSFKNNITDNVDFESYNIINQIVSEIEDAGSKSEYLILDSDMDKLWNFFRNRFVEIPAAGGLVQNSEGCLLFIRRLGVWDLPKGKIEKNETPARAAIREVEEECGLSGLSIVRQLDSTYHIYRSPYLNYPDNLVLKETKWFLMKYSGTETLVPQTEEDIEAVRWVQVSEMDEMLADTYLSLRDFLEKTLSAI